MNNIRIILRGYFQCSPDDWEARHKTLEIEDESLLELLKKGWEVQGAEFIKEVNNE